MQPPLAPFMLAALAGGTLSPVSALGDESGTSARAAVRSGLEIAASDSLANRLPWLLGHWKGKERVANCAQLFDVEHDVTVELGGRVLAIRTSGGAQWDSETLTLVSLDPSSSVIKCVRLVDEVEASEGMGEIDLDREELVLESIEGGSTIRRKFAPSSTGISLSVEASRPDGEIETLVDATLFRSTAGTFRGGSSGISGGGGGGDGRGRRVQKAPKKPPHSPRHGRRQPRRGPKKPGAPKTPNKPPPPTFHSPPAPNATTAPPGGPADSGPPPARP
jgi:hypothetical protein